MQLRLLNYSWIAVSKNQFANDFSLGANLSLKIRFWNGQPNLLLSL